MKYLSEFRDPVLADKLLNEIKIDIDLYEEVEKDKSATIQAGIVVVLSSLAAGVGALQLGVSNFAAWQVLKANLIAQKYNFPSVDILQPMYNIVKRQAEVEILPMATSEDIGVISYSPLGGGLLTGKYDASITARKNTSGRLHENEK